MSKEIWKEYFSWWTQGLKIGEYRLGDILGYHPILAWGGGVFGHVLRLDQSRANKSIGWIMSKTMN